MISLDELNGRFGRGTVMLASAGLKGDKRAFSMKQERRTPAYTTCLADMPTVRA
jgi:DNA polymerase V